MTATAIVAAIDEALRAAGDPARAEQELRYLKTDREHAGVRVPAVRRIARGVGRLDHDLLVPAVVGLWARPLFECRVAAVELLVHNVAVLGPADFDLVERLIRGSLRSATTFACTTSGMLTPLGC